MYKGVIPEQYYTNFVQLVTDKQVICSQLVFSEMSHCHAE